MDIKIKWLAVRANLLQFAATSLLSLFSRSALLTDQEFFYSFVFLFYSFFSYLLFRLTIFNCHSDSDQESGLVLAYGEVKRGFTL